MESFSGKLAVVPGGGPGMPNTAYAAAKFAVRGFTEALIEGLHSLRAHGLPEPGQMNDAQAEGLIPSGARAGLIRAGLLPASPMAGDLRQALARVAAGFRDKAPLSAVGAAAVILDGVRSGAWRILVGQDARWIDEAVRARPEAADDYAELFSTARHPLRPR